MAFPGRGAIIMDTLALSSVQLWVIKSSYIPIPACFFSLSLFQRQEIVKIFHSWKMERPLDSPKRGGGHPREKNTVPGPGRRW